MVEGGNNSDFLLGFFEAHLEDLEDLGFIFSLGFQRIYKDIDGGGDFGVNRWGGRRRGVGFGSTDVLGVRVSVFLALGGVVARESTTKALSFPDAFGPFSRGKFGQSDGIRSESVV